MGSRKATPEVLDFIRATRAEHRAQKQDENMKIQERKKDEAWGLNVHRLKGGEEWGKGEGERKEGERGGEGERGLRIIKHKRKQLTTGGNHNW